MHTSDVLTASDFSYFQREGEAWVPASFATLFPNYHELDRIGVVAPDGDQGLLATGATLLALTTAFYDQYRQRGGKFFDYPHHFALLGERADFTIESEKLSAETGEQLERTWGNLDVWPETNWWFTPPTATEMLRLAFSLQINRLFWPAWLFPGPDEAWLPSHVRKMLGSRLKSVHLYGSENPQVAVLASPHAQAILERSVAHLAEPLPSGIEIARNASSTIHPQKFLETFAPE